MFREFTITNTTLKHTLFKAVDELYVRELRYPKLVYAQVTTINIITQLCDRYGTIDLKMVEGKNKEMSTELTPETRIAIQFKKMDDIISYDKPGIELMSNKPITHIALKIVKNTGQLNIAIHYWYKKPKGTKPDQNTKLSLWRL